jgi:hypothetical protein
LQFVKDLRSVLRHAGRNASHHHLQVERLGARLQAVGGFAEEDHLAGSELNDLSWC